MKRETVSAVRTQAAGAVPGSSGVRIDHERPAPDTETHVIAPLILTLPDGRRLTARKWSLSGIRDAILSGEDLTDARLMIPFQGIEVGFPVLLTPSADGTVWAFEGLTGRQREVLGLFYRNLMTGKMAATDEVITALDTPVDLVPMGETDEEKAVGMAKVKPRALRVVWKLVYYALLLAVVGGYLGSLVWNRLDHAPLSNARYVAPYVELAAPNAGFVAQIVAADQTAVAAGALLIRMTDPEADEGLADVRGVITQAELRLAEVEVRKNAHLAGRAAAPAAAVDPDQFDAGISVLPGDFHDIRQRLEQDARMIVLELRALRAERGRLRDRARGLEVLAPASGRVDRVLVSEAAYQRVGTPLLVFETDAPRRILGWLDASEAAHVWQGMRASVLYSVAGETRAAAATVTAIEAGTDPMRPDAYGLVVHLELTGLTLADTRALLPHNAAVEVRLHRDLAQRWFGIGG